MSLKITSEPAVPPLTTAEAKTHLRVTSSADDSDIADMIEAARGHAENITNRALINRTYEWRLDAFPAVLEVPRPPLVSVSTILYVDTDGATQTLATADYQVDTPGDMPARIRPSYGNVWPSTRAEMDAVTVTFVAGYGDAVGEVPASIRAAMLLMIGGWHAFREPSVQGQYSELPLGVQPLLFPYRIWSA